MAILAAVDHAAWKTLVILRIELFAIVVTRNVQCVGKAGAGRQLRKRHGASNRTGAIHIVNDLRQLPRQHRQTARIWFAHIVHTLGGRFIGIVIAKHFLKKWRDIGIIGIIDLIADGPEDYAGMVAISFDHAFQISLVPLRKILCIAEVLRRIDIVTVPPFVFGALPFVEGLIHDQQPHLVAQIQ